MGTAIYARISKDADQRGLGVDRQLEDCRGLVLRLGWGAGDVALYVDNDVSASSGKPRPEYLRLLADVKARKVDAVAVWDVDRLTRRPAELEEFIGLADVYGLRLASVGGEVDLGTPQGRLTARIKGAVARHEVEQQSRRIKRKIEELVAEGRPFTGGLRPFGYDETRLAVVEAEADLIREAARRVLAGESLRSISRDWTARGVLTVTGKPWSTQSLRNSLTAPRTTGLISHRGKVAGEAAWPAILDRTTWDAVRHVLLDPARNVRPDTSAPRRFWWSGLVRCQCGARMGRSPIKSTGRVSWRCLTDSGGCGRVTIEEKHLEPMVTRAVVRTAPLLGMPDPAKEVDRSVVLDAAISGLEARLEALAEAFADDGEDGDPRAYLDASKALRRRLEALREERAGVVVVEAAERAIVRDVEALAERFEALPVERQRALADAVLEGVVVGPGRAGRFAPDRVSFIWRLHDPAPVAEEEA